MLRITQLTIAVSAICISLTGCSSPEMSVARKAYNAKDWAKARISVEKAIAADPTNCEAYLLQGQTLQQLNEIPSMVQSLRKARDCNGVKPAIRNDAQTLLYQTWAGQYNSGVESYNSWVTSSDKSHLNDAIRHLESALEIQPELSDPLSLLGVVYEMKADTVSAIRTYEKWYSMEQPSAELLLQKGVTLGLSRGELLKKMGTPVSTRQDSVGEALVTSDKFDIGGRDLFVFSTSYGAPDAQVEGWTLNPSMDLPERIRSRSRQLKIGAMRGLAYIYYERGDYAKASQWVNRVRAWNPQDTELTDLRIELLRRNKGKKEAMQEALQVLESRPTNIAALLTVAEMYDENDNREQAIATYKKVLELQPQNEAALYSLAALYKNSAGAKQAAERKKREADPKYRENDQYLADLQTSAGYYEQLRRLPKYHDDLDVIEQLGNIYEVRGETNKVRTAIQELEALESKYSTSKKYYYILEGFYQRNKMPEKVKIAQQKGAKL